MSVLDQQLQVDARADSGRKARRVCFSSSALARVRLYRKCCVRARTSITACTCPSACAPQPRTRTARRVLPRQMLGGDTAGGSCARHREQTRIHHGDVLAGLRFRQQNDTLQRLDSMRMVLKEGARSGRFASAHCAGAQRGESFAPWIRKRYDRSIKYPAHFEVSQMETDLGKLIKALRVGKRKTLKQISEKTELSISFLSQVERGKSSITLESLKKFPRRSMSVRVTFSRTCRRRRRPGCVGGATLLPAIIRRLSFTKTCRATSPIPR